MKRSFIRMAAYAAAVVVALAAILSAPAVALADGGTPMWRLYNPNSGEHFYTAGVAERNNLVSVGWRFEGVGWIAPESGQDVYRLYNRNGGDHHYTVSAGERDMLVAAGWRDEGVGWKSGGSVPVYRQYNKNASTGSHNFTTSKAENDMLVAAGWKAEGTAWQAMGTSADYDPSPANAEVHAFFQASIDQYIAEYPDLVEWYGYLDLDGDEIDEMVLQELDPEDARAHNIKVFGFWDEYVYYVGYCPFVGCSELHVYPKTMSLIAYHTDMGKKAYMCYHLKDLVYVDVAASVYVPANVSGRESDFHSYYEYSDGTERACSQQEYDALVAKCTQGPCTVYSVAEWATMV